MFDALMDVGVSDQGSDVYLKEEDLATVFTLFYALMNVGI